jgi:steroid delta-isomerase-like uncharacterized protein
MESELERYLRDYYEAWSQQNVDAVMKFFTASSSFEDLAFAVKLEGVKQIRSFVILTYAGSPDFQARPTQIVVSDGLAAAAWTMTGTHLGDYPGLPATGKHFTVRASSMVNFDGDKIKTIVDYWNPIEFRRSVGLT